MFFSIKELSEYLKIKPSTLYAWSSRGIIPHYKVYGLIRFKKDEVDVWIASFRKDKLPNSISSLNRRDSADIDSVIARAKREVYNDPLRGNQTAISPKKGG